jgi:hypothetical protein
MGRSSFCFESIRFQLARKCQYPKALQVITDNVSDI